MCVRVGGRTDCPHYPTDPEPSFQEDPEEPLGQAGERTHLPKTLDRVSTQTCNAVLQDQHPFEATTRNADDKQVYRDFI